MIYLVDTNVILRLVDAAHPLHGAARRAMERLQTSHQLQTSAQNFVEFWNVATRPASVNGLGWKPSKAARVLAAVEDMLPLLPDAPEIYALWRQLVSNFEVSGVQAHDARLVAVMKAHRISRILTFNTRDFLRYEEAGILAVDPASASLD